MKGSMELLHPFIPFITEEIWQSFKNNDEQSIVISQWEDPDGSFEDLGAEKGMAFLQDTISSLRNMRSEMDVPPGKVMDLIVSGKKDLFDLIEINQQYLKSLAKVENIKKLDENFDKNAAAATVVQGVEFFVPLSDLIDKEKERARLKKELIQLQNLERVIKKKLNNKNFVERAPQNVVEGEQKKLSDVQENLEKVKLNYEKYI